MDMRVILVGVQDHGISVLEREFLPSELPARGQEFRRGVPAGIDSTML
jgi:hypothetical protein